MNKILSGIDLVELDEFKRNLQLGGDKFKNRVFLKQELTKNQKPESLAGIFAAKEAVIKALNLSPGNWKQIEIVKQKSGKPLVKFKGKLGSKLTTHDLSISHTKDYSVAIFMTITT